MSYLCAGSLNEPSSWGIRIQVTSTILNQGWNFKDGQHAFLATFEVCSALERAVQYLNRPRKVTVIEIDKAFEDDVLEKNQLAFVVTATVRIMATVRKIHAGQEQTVLDLQPTEKVTGVKGGWLRTDDAFLEKKRSMELTRYRY